jgi:hypothetical protein
MTLSQLFGLCKSQRYFQESLLFNFLVHENTFQSIFSSKKFSEKVGRKLVRVRIRIRPKIVRIRNTGCKSLPERGTISDGSVEKSAHEKSRYKHSSNTVNIVIFMHRTVLGRGKYCVVGTVPARFF